MSSESALIPTKTILPRVRVRAQLYPLCQTDINSVYNIPVGETSERAADASDVPSDKGTREAESRTEGLLSALPKYARQIA
ncbi:hypothetical protein PoB_005317600 [Plakobranchus ocellatus]|uniref:Uncharacterized protein n=1 Tax=Plakobranchus ocellatus TaxID=259542 RepID=A0AAV4C5P5_9GAST|nr:hypothetical protein PoB_005317600 [Plakobranchus ocellatus]